MNNRCNELLSRCALQDYESFQQLYKLSSPRLFAVAKHILNNNEQAEEVLQEAMIKIWRKSNSYRPDLSNAMTWMTRIVRNQTLDYLRSQVRVNTHIDTNIDVETLNQLLFASPESKNDPLLTASIQACMDTIQQQHKQSISLIYFMGLTYKEVAKSLDRPIGTIKGWVHRGLEGLKLCLDH